MNLELVDILGKWAVAIFGVLGTLTVGLIILIAKRLYGAITTLFIKHEEQNNRIARIEMFLVHLATLQPNSVELFRLLFKEVKRD